MPSWNAGPRELAGNMIIGNGGWADLLPIHAADIALRATEPIRGGIFMEAAVTALLRSLLDAKGEDHTGIWIELPRQGLGFLRPGDPLSFTLFADAGNKDRFECLIDRLGTLPQGAPVKDRRVPLRDNLVLDEIRRRPVYDAEALAMECASWRERAQVRIVLKSPLRMLREERSRVRGEARFAHDLYDLPVELFLRRLHASLGVYARERGFRYPPLPGDLHCTALGGVLFWVQTEYRDKHGRSQPLGGLLGELAIEWTATPDDALLELLVLGQYFGCGQRRAFGLGRYRLEALDGHTSVRELIPPTTLLQRVAEPHNLDIALAHVRSKADPQLRWRRELADVANHGDDADVVRVEQLARRLVSGEWEAAPLLERTLPKRDGGTRRLAIPPFLDRVAQRAVVQVLEPALGMLAYAGSFGFRRGLSRLQARDRIQLLYRRGHRHVLESDIHDFFDSVLWPLVFVRLSALLGKDTLVDMIMAWVQAPLVGEDGEAIPRERGLPQGSPLSPILANLLLDDFDRDLANQGFELVRYADDFVIPCKSQVRAREARAAAEHSLAEVGLHLHPDKTRITSFEKGFRFLGYTFVNDLAVDSPRSTRETESSTPKTSSAGDADYPADPDAACASVTETPVAQMDGSWLLVNGPRRTLRLAENQVQVWSGSELLLSAPLGTIASVITFGAVHVTTPLIRALLKDDVELHHARNSGAYLGCTAAPERGFDRVQSQLAQARYFADPENTLPLAKEVVEARIRHQKEVLRQRGIDDDVLDSALQQIAQADDASALNGVEGRAAAAYFGQIATLLGLEWRFSARKRRPAPDPFNALLSLGYTVVYGHADTLLRAAGLQPVYGFYHVSRGRHSALASDIMEPLRHVVERTALTMIRRREIKPGQFRYDAERGCLVDREVRSQYLARLVDSLHRKRMTTDGRDLSGIGALRAMAQQLVETVSGRSPGFRAIRWR